MKNISRTLLTLMLVALAVFASQAQEEETKKETNSRWHTDYKAAQAESKETGKPILMDFTGSDWCGWCIKLDEEVFSTEEFETWAKQNVVLLKLDFPRKGSQSDAEKAQNQELAEKYGIRGFPTIVFAKDDGSTIAQYGYDAGGPSVWTKKAGEMLAGDEAPVSDEAPAPDESPAPDEAPIQDDTP